MLTQVGLRCATAQELSILSPELSILSHGATAQELAILSSAAAAAAAVAAAVSGGSPLGAKHTLPPLCVWPCGKYHITKLQ